MFLYQSPLLNKQLLFPSFSVIKIPPPPVRTVMLGSPSSSRCRRPSTLVHWALVAMVVAAAVVAASAEREQVDDDLQEDEGRGHERFARAAGSGWLGKRIANQRNESHTVRKCMMTIAIYF
jgi:hypothetical protein